MTTPPPPIYAPPEYVPPPPRRPLAAGAIVAWGVIVLCVAAMLARDVWTPYVRPAARGGRSASTQPALQPISEIRSVQLKLVSLYAVGAREFTRQQPRPPTSGPASIPTTATTTTASRQAPHDPLARTVEQSITNPVDDFRSIPVIAELEGTDAALARLARFEKQYQVVRLRPDVDALRTLYTRGPDALTDRQANDLVQRHGWFGELALAYGHPDSDPRRQAVLAPASRAVMIGMLATFGGFGALVLGIVLGILALVRYSDGRLSRAYRPDPPGQADRFVEAFALYLTTFIALSIALALLFPHAVFWPNWAISIVLPLVLVWLHRRGAPWPQVRRALGWHAGRGFFREIGAGVVGYLTGLPVIGVGLILTLVLTQRTGIRPTHPVQNMPTDAPTDVLQILILAAAWAPIIEETMFRGALFHHLRSRFGWWVSTIIVSLIFAAIHPQGWTLIPALGAIAFVLAGIREWRGSIIGCMTAHALHNGALVMLFVMSVR
ncbi:MAG TPA: type II CAAX endopeptidase family protein [Tepidisphaeraceae bacterium]